MAKTMALRSLDHYEILERLGEGDRAFLYKARDTASGSTVAIKVIPAWMRSDRTTIGRLEREIAIEKSLNHPNVIKLYDIGEAEVEDPELVGSAYDASGRAKVVYLVKEFIEGEDLRDKLDQKKLTRPEVVRIAIQIAEGLRAAHQAGVVHRNLHPGNVRITQQGTAKLLGFGLAKLLAEEAATHGGAFRTGSGKLLGTVPYLSPEQVQEQPVDERSDLFSLGVLMYQMISGEMPFPSGSLMDYFHAVVHEKPKRLSEVAVGVRPYMERIVDKLLEKDPAGRYQSAAEVVAALTEFEAHAV